MVEPTRLTSARTATTMSYPPIGTIVQWHAAGSSGSMARTTFATHRQATEFPMSTTQTSQENMTGIPGTATDLKLEVVAIPVSDVDRAKRFYEGLRWNLDADFWVGKDFRAVQLTPPGSQCSIHLAT